VSIFLVFKMFYTISTLCLMFSVLYRPTVEVLLVSFVCLVDLLTVKSVSICNLVLTK